MCLCLLQVLLVFLLLLPWPFRDCLAIKILHFYYTYKQFWCNEKMSRIKRIDTTSHLLRPSRSGVVSCNQRGNIIMHRLQFFCMCNGWYRYATHFADLQSRIAFSPKDLFGMKEYTGVTIADTISVAHGAALWRWITASLNVSPGELLWGVTSRKYILGVYCFECYFWILCS